jgi:hypothetical protein
MQETKWLGYKKEGTVELKCTLCGGEVLSVLVTCGCSKLQMNLSSSTVRLLCRTEREITMADRNTNCEHKKLIIF